MAGGREPKRVLGREDFGGDVLFNGDRCVMCTRCVRFMREVAEDERLTVVERGNRAVIDTFFDQGLEGSPFAGNIVDICPVGALVSKDFLYKARAWDLDRTPSVCPSCTQGCNITLQTRDNLVQRLKPRENLDVNGWWMCDFGRQGYEWMNRADRIQEPLVGGEPTSWTEALQALAREAPGGEGRSQGGELGPRSERGAGAAQGPCHRAGWWRGRLSLAQDRRGSRLFPASPSWPAERTWLPTSGGPRSSGLSESATMMPEGAWRRFGTTKESSSCLGIRWRIRTRASVPVPGSSSISEAMGPRPRPTRILSFPSPPSRSRRGASRMSRGGSNASGPGSGLRARPGPDGSSWEPFLRN